jgi:hypothetical protein
MGEIVRSGQFGIYIHLNPKQVLISQKDSCNLVPILVNLSYFIENHPSMVRKIIHQKGGRYEKEIPHRVPDLGGSDCCLAF